MELLYYTAFCKICPLKADSYQVISENETNNLNYFCNYQQKITITILGYRN